ncbi:MAG: hypothetical protein SNJ58_11535 [Aggregatilineales bacterium]
MLFWISLAIAALSLFNGLGALNVISTLPALRELPIEMPLVVLIGVPLLWCIVFAGLGLGLLLKNRRAARLLAPLLTAYALSRLGMALFAQDDYSRERLGAQIALTAVWISIAWWYTRRIERHFAEQAV